MTRKHIVLGAGLALTLGTAVASIYGRQQAESVLLSERDIATAPSSQLSPEDLAILKATAVFTDYMAPKLPL